ncbi:MAG: LysR family transcriptional regulator [Eubacteriales bacterium]|nr:LysR family transcriptional regulator [Eubacteriales bacterium]
MEIKQLEYVIMAAEMGSFNKASEFLYTTQSNVSKVINSLEEELGYKIFRRQGKGVVLTDAGKVLYEQSQQIMVMLNKFATFSDLADKSCFHIASVVSNCLAWHFSNFIKDYKEEDLCLKMWEGSITRVIELVEQGEVELGFVYIGGRQKDSFKTMLQRKGLVFEHLLPARVVVSVGPNNPFYNKDFVTTDELKTLSFIRYREDNLSKTYHLHQLEETLQLRHAMNHAVEVDSDYALLNILTYTDYAYLCYGGISDENYTSLNDLRSIPVLLDEPDISLGYIKRKGVPLTCYAEDFLSRLHHI